VNSIGEAELHFCFVRFINCEKQIVFSEEILDYSLLQTELTCWSPPAGGSRVQNPPGIWQYGRRVGCPGPPSPLEESAA
jgi:hypothetical protein